MPRKKKIEQQLAQEQHKKQRLENRIAYYERGDRTDRAHNLIVRSADMESIAPLASLTRAEFYAFAEKVFDLPEVKVCSWKRSTNTTGLNRKRGAEYRVIPFSCNPDQAQRGTIRVASAAYRAGEKLHSEYYGEDSDYSGKGGVICSEILLPSHAPAIRRP